MLSEFVSIKLLIMLLSTLNNIVKWKCVIHVVCSVILRYHSNNVERFVSVGIFVLRLHFKYKTILLRTLIMIEYLLFWSSLFDNLVLNVIVCIS